MSCFAVAAVHKRVGEAAYVACCNPNLGVHKYGRVKSYIVRIFLNKLFPPCFFYVVFEFNAERAVVPGV